GRAIRASGPPTRIIDEITRYSRLMMSTPRVKPAIGDVTIGSTTFHSRPLLVAQSPPPACDQIRASQLLWAAASAAPQSAPIKACDDEDGRPRHHVIKFQMIAPDSAAMSTWDVTLTTCVSTSPEAMVLATAVPMNAPIRFVVAARMIACPGVSTLVATTVAIEFAVSWKPLMNSKTSAVKITSS